MKGIRRLFSRPTNGYGKGGRHGFSRGKLGIAKSGSNSNGVRVRRGRR